MRHSVLFHLHPEIVFMLPNHYDWVKSSDFRFWSLDETD